MGAVWTDQKQNVLGISTQELFLILSKISYDCPETKRRLLLPLALTEAALIARAASGGELAVSGTVSYTGTLAS